LGLQVIGSAAVSAQRAFMLQCGSIGSIDAGKHFRRGGDVGVWGRCRGERGVRWHPATVRFSWRVGQLISNLACGGRGVCTPLLSLGCGRRLSGRTGTRVPAQACSASLFSRESRSPVWAPAFAGEHALLGNWGCRSLGGGALPRCAPLGALPHPDPPLKGRELCLSPKRIPHPPMRRHPRAGGDPYPRGPAILV
jgi:hypothetical protein